MTNNRAPFSLDDSYVIPREYLFVLHNFAAQALNLTQGGITKDFLKKSFKDIETIIKKQDNSQLVAAPADMVMQWRDISTAPHNQIVLLYSPGTGCESNPPRIECDYASHGWQNEIASNLSRHGWATHWMPLPPTPQEGGQDA